MKIEYKRLTPEEVEDFQDEKSLYVFDFRALGEELFMEIPEMRKYENLGKWITKNKYHTVNEEEELNKHRIQLKHNPLSKDTIFSRLRKVEFLKEITKLWVAVPHPDSDLLAIEKNLELNYSHFLFEKLNDKLFQKKFLGDLAPKHIEINNFLDLKNILEKDNNFFLKKRHGSGSFTSYDCQKNDFKILSSNEFIRKYISKGDFFLEKKIIGKSLSVQIFKKNEKYTIFGFTEQLFDKDGFYEGNFIYSPELIKDKKFIEEVINKCDLMLREYNGFFGIDFMKEKSGKNYVLELNVRVTAVTVPTLVSNEKNFAKSQYLENVKALEKDDLILTSFKEEKTFDVLRRLDSN